MAVCSLGEEHKTVMLSILATLSAAVILFVVTVAINGGFSVSLFKSYVLPLFMSAFTLAVFWTFLFARHKGKLPVGLVEQEQKPAAPATTPPGTQTPPQQPAKPT